LGLGLGVGELARHEGHGELDGQCNPDEAESQAAHGRFQSHA
jgi:hypothetical protein